MVTAFGSLQTVVAQSSYRVPSETPPFLPLGSMEDNSVSSSVAKVIRNVSRESSRQAMPAFHVGITEQAHVEKTGPRCPTSPS